MLSEKSQLLALDLDKNTIHKIESGERIVTDIEVKMIRRFLTFQTMNFCKEMIEF